VIRHPDVGLEDVVDRLQADELDIEHGRSRLARWAEVASASSVTQPGTRVMDRSRSRSSDAMSASATPTNRSSMSQRRRSAMAASRLALALEDRSGDVGLVHHEREHRAIAPPTQEEVAVDIHPSVG
jgi:hypothetical protein